MNCSERGVKWCKMLQNMDKRPWNWMVMNGTKQGQYATNRGWVLRNGGRQ